MKREKIPDVKEETDVKAVEKTVTDDDVNTRGLKKGVMTAADVKRERIADVKEEIVVKEEQPMGEPTDSDGTDEYCPSSNLAVSKFAASLLNATWGYSSFRKWQEVTIFARHI